MCSFRFVIFIFFCLSPTQNKKEKLLLTVFILKSFSFVERRIWNFNDFLFFFRVSGWFFVAGFCDSIKTEQLAVRSSIRMLEISIQRPHQKFIQNSCRCRLRFSFALNFTKAQFCTSQKALKSLIKGVVKFVVRSYF